MFGAVENGDAVSEARCFATRRASPRGMCVPLPGTAAMLEACGIPCLRTYPHAQKCSPSVPGSVAGCSHVLRQRRSGMHVARSGSQSRDGSDVWELGAAASGRAVAKFQVRVCLMLCVFVFWCRCHRHRAFVRTCPGNCSVEICVCKCVFACV